MAKKRKKPNYTAPEDSIEFNQLADLLRKDQAETEARFGWIKRGAPIDHEETKDECFERVMRGLNEMAAKEQKNPQNSPQTP